MLSAIKKIFRPTVKPSEDALIPRGLMPSRKLLILTGTGILDPDSADLFDPSGERRTELQSSISMPQSVYANAASQLAGYFEERRRAAALLEPNSAHWAMTRLARVWPGEMHIATTCVDDLHARAGLKNVSYLMGRLSETICPVCSTIVSDDDEHLLDRRCPVCAYHGPHRPNIVMRSEAVRDLAQFMKRLDTSDVFIMIGQRFQADPFSHMFKRAALNNLQGVRSGEPDCQTINVGEYMQVSKFIREEHPGHPADVLPGVLDNLLRPN